MSWESRDGLGRGLRRCPLLGFSSSGPAVSKPYPTVVAVEFEGDSQIFTDGIGFTLIFGHATACASWWGRLTLIVLSGLKEFFLTHTLPDQTFLT